MNVFALLAILLAARGTPSPSPTAQPSAAAPGAPLSPDALYSRRALRRARLLIEMRMLQFRDERLECVRAALLRQLPLALRPQEPTTWAAADRACFPPSSGAKPGPP